MPYPSPLHHAAGTAQDRPMFVITYHPDGSIRYRCWDTVERYVGGDLADVDKIRWHFGSVMAALLADQARLHVERPYAQSVLVERWEPEE